MTAWTATTRRRVRALMETVARAGEVFPAMESAGAEATALLPLLRERHPIAKRLPGPSRKESREARRKRHAEETAAIREERMRISRGVCEEIGCSQPATQMHHLLPGHGRRRQQQHVDTVRMLCVIHHAERHRASKRANGGTT